jgi:hypothetical protein
MELLYYYKEVVGYIEYDKFIGDINDRIIKINGNLKHFNVCNYNNVLFVICNTHIIQ